MISRTSLILTRLQPAQARIGLILLEIEVRKARLQFVRIRQDVTKIEALFRALENEALSIIKGSGSPAASISQQKDVEPGLALFADVHFLLNCLDKVDILIRMLESLLPTNQKLMLVRASHANTLKEWNDFRNHLEHIDERVRRGVSDLGNLGNDLFTFDGKALDIGPACQKEFGDIFSETLTALENP